MNTFKCKILSPDSVIFEGEAWQFSATDELGAFSVRARHRDILARLKPGTVEIAKGPEDRQRFSISSGFLTMRKNFCLVICDKPYSFTTRS